MGSLPPWVVTEQGPQDPAPPGKKGESCLTSSGEPAQPALALGFSFFYLTLSNWNPSWWHCPLGALLGMRKSGPACPTLASVHTDVVPLVTFIQSPRFTLGLLPTLDSP